VVVSKSGQEIIELRHVDKTYPPNQIALRDLDFTVRRGEFIFIAGASGAGKSSLLKLLFAQERSTRGQVLVRGVDLSNLSTSSVAWLRRSVGVIFQDYKLLQTRTVIDNVAFALEVLGVRKRERYQLAFNLLTAVGLKDKIKSYPRMLSGGEQQRVAIVRALMNRPQLVLADEPTGNLDPDMTAIVFNLLLEANRCGATVLVASHNLQLIEEMNKRTLVLDKGKLVGDFAQTKSL